MLTCTLYTAPRILTYTKWKLAQKRVYLFFHCSIYKWQTLNDQYHAKNYLKTWQFLQLQSENMSGLFCMYSISNPAHLQWLHFWHSKQQIQLSEGLTCRAQYTQGTKRGLSGSGEGIRTMTPNWRQIRLVSSKRASSEIFSTSLLNLIHCSWYHSGACQIL